MKVKNNQVYVIGKMTRLDNKEYPFMIYDENENKVYVGSDGTIVNSRGSTVGKLSAPRS